MFSYPMELHTKITNKIRVFDAFKNLQFISCFFDGFVIIWLKSYLQERFFIISHYFKLPRNNNNKNNKTNHQKRNKNKTQTLKQKTEPSYFWKIMWRYDEL